ncbi:MAG: hypothetical protein Hyperionvirus1_131 [Hyperionvirus sp.]|uniref:Uncharacterized protein n=1 Tax=Hyperionvirus sp. TaxID=2487770 RepID=A0A3G5A6A2_9VIRU|nr:MAG: hypothetical protein Hyperionvirus1_131 [Hyperionvirus sp.]
MIDPIIAIVLSYLETLEYLKGVYEISLDHGNGIRDRGLECLRGNANITLAYG